MPGPDIAVVVIFRERTAYVDQCLEALRAMEGGPWPIVLVPDAPVAEYEGLALQAPTPGGISRKRNAGAAAVPEGCTHVAYIDSDAYPRPDWLVRARECLRQAPEGVVAVTGPAMTPPDDSWWRRISGHAMASVLIMGRQVSANYRDYGPVEPVPNASTCNLVIRREALRAVGGFDESLRTSEDVALSDAIVAAGLRILRDPSVVVYHHRRGLGHFWLQWFNEGLALKRRRQFRHAGSLLVCLPSLLLLGQAALAVAGLWLGAWAWGTLAAMEAGQLVLFAADRLHARVPWGDAFGAALAMWGFPKAYGLGGILSFMGGWRLYVFSRNDPPAEAARNGLTGRGGPGYDGQNERRSR